MQFFSFDVDEPENLKANFTILPPATALGVSTKTKWTASWIWRAASQSGFKEFKNHDEALRWIASSPHPQAQEAADELRAQVDYYRETPA